MKVRIEYTVEVSDEERLALTHFLGDKGHVTREEIRAFFERHGTASGRQQIKEMVTDYYQDLAKEYAEKAKQLKDE
jgi:cytochrome c551/c552